MRGGSDTVAHREHVQPRLTWILRSVAPIYSGRKPQSSGLANTLAGWNLSCVREFKAAGQVFPL